MVPCYQICKDRGCSHWNEKLVDCSRLPDECEYVIEHLVGDDRDNQKLDEKWHGFWRDRYVSGQLRSEIHFVNGKKDGFCRAWSKDGKLISEDVYVDGVLLLREIGDDSLLSDM